MWKQYSQPAKYMASMKVVCIYLSFSRVEKLNPMGSPEGPHVED